MSNYDSFTVTKRATGIGERYDFILHGPKGAEFTGSNGHACLDQAIYAATRGLSRPLRFDGMEDGTEPIQKCGIKRSMDMADLHVHVHVVGIPKIGKIYGSRPSERAA